MREIKRLTTIGVKKSELEDGYLIEIHGYQFAFVDDKENEIRFLIELSTGHSAISIYPFKNKKKEFKQAVAFVSRVSKEKMDDTINYVRKFRKIRKPLNEPIIL